MTKPFDRNSGIGSSEAAVVAGVSKYKTRTELLYEKAGLVPSDWNSAGTAFTRWGHLLEAPIAQVYARETGRRVQRHKPCRHRQLPFLFASLDYRVLQPKGDQPLPTPGVLEVKSTSRWSSHEDWRDGVPDEYLLQVHHQMLVTGYRWGSLAVLFGDKQFRHYDIDYDAELADLLLEKLRHFWEQVLKVRGGAAPPPFDEPPDATFLKRLYPKDSGTVITLGTPDVINVLDNLQGVKVQLSSLKDEEERLEGMLKLQMGDAAEAQVPGWGRVTWRTAKDSETVDTEKLKRDFPDVWAAVKKLKPGGRRFAVKPGKELARRTDV